ncbi:serine/threonine protein kinase [Dulcicalothrix desertica PCC 7102]|uniref:Serine/threonine protein kinase n=1 Tax=Dulcicalothrix desertica PCC 7102 TaxID=232991 RepID=A0A3S1CEN5_9CYAN|nr:serine/threonine-protein kinase [Dulcicalothrix desertica]RUT02058.1 serine/threonine protein kinase [Dulcicalothrix desertica PCC 7102]TWH53705.1 serine/threonine-protein kinase [Dulcicalothrix desertica PCC 7102]
MKTSMLSDIQDEVMHKAELDGYIGKFLNNRYLIRDLIGKGGMGRVYLAEDAAKGGMPVAVKILSLSIDNQQISQRFGREIFIGAQLGRKSKQIARVLSYGITDEKIPFYVMEYLQGRNLKAIIKSNSLNLTKSLEILYQICLGLQCAHQGISLKGEIYPVLHRDIKPENIFIAEDPKQGDVVKILDFGIAKFLTERAGMTLTESFIGSLPYCSPEHMEGRKLIDVRSDIYSLGVLMYEMLTGQHPFALKTNSFGDWYQAHKFQVPPTFKEINPDLKIPRELQELVMTCLAKEVKNRPQDMGKILSSLERIQQLENGEVLNSTNQSYNPANVQLVPVTSISEKICLQKTWPVNKPKALICFPHLLQSTQGSIPTLWAMLPKKEIDVLVKQINNTEFIFQKNLYPLLLWVTTLCDKKFDLTRWLSYFLDMKDSKSQKIAQALVNTGYYHLLFFSLENPGKCEKVITLTLCARQRQQIIDCLESIENTKSIIELNESKNMLRLHLEKKKPEIISQLAENQRNQKFSVREWLNYAVSKVSRVVSRPVFRGKSV